jgi:hypothetical protein
MSKLQRHLMVPPFLKSSWCANDVTFFFKNSCKRTQQERWNRKEDRSGLNPSSKNNLSLHLVANLSLFQQPIACDCIGWLWFF